MSEPRGALLVGSVNFDDAETTMRTAAETVGPLLKRIPDGEVGARFHWILFQPDVISRADGLERIGDVPIPVRGLDARPVRIADGVDAASIVLPPLGYAHAAIESYGVFTRLREEGVIAPGVRFQVSLPTPVGVIAAFFRGDDRPAIEPVYAAALHGELERIVAAIPHADLAIQWDVATEFAILESGGYDDTFGGAYSGWFADEWRDLPARLQALIDQVPDDVEVGIHLCYGDAGEKHFIEPTDTANLVRFANEVLADVRRPLTWLHLPVPIERDDAAYFAPLAELALPGDTELYLGLVHREDGAEGARRRIAAASEVVPRFGVATECGALVSRVKRDPSAVRRKDDALEMLDEMRLPHFRSIIREYVMHTDAPLTGDVVATYPRSRAAVNAIDDYKDLALELTSLWANGNR